jgi:hypothetical protein
MKEKTGDMMLLKKHLPSGLKGEKNGQVPGCG